MLLCCQVACFIGQATAKLLALDNNSGRLDNNSRRPAGSMVLLFSSYQLTSMVFLFRSNAVSGF